MKICLNFLLLFVLNSILFANDSNPLFIIERSRDLDQILYQVSLDNEGKLDAKNPISVHWLRRTNNDIIEPLTWVQERFSYGLEYLIQEPNRVVFQFEGYNKRSFELKKNLDGNFKVYTLSKGKEVEVLRIFIQIDGGTFWIPTIPRVELHSRDPKINLAQIEIVKP